MIHSQTIRSISTTQIYRSEPKPNRIVKRNTLAAFILLTAAALLIGVAVHFGGNKGDVPKDTKIATYTTTRGDTLWGIATKFDTRDNPVAAEDWIKQRNGIGDTIQPGITLTVPVGR